MPLSQDSLSNADDLLDRFGKALTKLGVEPDDPLGIAVSGGADSVALLLLAHHGHKGPISAATVNHGLRPEAAGEAAMVAQLCDRLGVDHQTLDVKVFAHRESIQAAARRVRYEALARWSAAIRFHTIATAHHADDQAETILMRLARGAGVRGLSGIRRTRYVETRYPNPRRDKPGEPWMWPTRIKIARPLLNFDKRELERLVTDAGITPIDDPSNTDPAYDRTHARKLLAENPWLRPKRLAAVADHARDVEIALSWASREAFNNRAVETDDMYWELNVKELPDEIVRRCVKEILYYIEEKRIASAPEYESPGPKIARFITVLREGGTATLAGAIGKGGDIWTFGPAPPRRDES